MKQSHLAASDVFHHVLQFGLQPSVSYARVSLPSHDCSPHSNCHGGMGPIPTVHLRHQKAKSEAVEGRKLDPSQTSVDTSPSREVSAA